MELLPVVSILVTVVGLISGFLIQHFAVITKIMSRLTKLETQMSPFWKMLEAELPKLIHSPHTPDLDNLLDKMSKGKLSIGEYRNLRDKLKIEMEDSDTAKKIAIILLLVRLDQIIHGDKK